MKREFRAGILMSGAVALVLGCGEQRHAVTTEGSVTCYLAWLGDVMYDGPSLQVQTCWNTKCSAVLEPTVVALPPPESAPEETTDVPDDGTVDFGEPCESVPQTSETPMPCAAPGEPREDDPTLSLFPHGVDPNCGFDNQHSDFPVRACARALSPDSIFLEARIWPHPNTPGRGQDLLRDGDELSLHLAGADGAVLAEHTVAIDQYNVASSGGSSCKSAGFTLEGEPL